MIRGRFWRITERLLPLPETTDGKGLEKVFPGIPVAGVRDGVAFLEFRYYSRSRFDSTFLKKRTRDFLFACGGAGPHQYVP